MPTDDRNIYKKARKGSGLTQEAAAERLGLSVESIRAYETGQRVPPDETVNDMAVCYNALYLPYQHLQAYNTLASRVVPALEDRGLLTTCVMIYNRLKGFAATGRVEQLLQIAEDGIIDEGERAEFYAIVTDLREIVRGGMELEVYCRDAGGGGEGGHYA